MGDFRKFGVPYLGVLIIGTLLFKVLYLDLLFSETPISSQENCLSGPASFDDLLDTWRTLLGKQPG